MIRRILPLVAGLLWASSAFAADYTAAQRLLRPDARALRRTSTRRSRQLLEGKTGQSVDDQAVARRLGQAGARGDRRPRGRRRHARARLRHRRDRRQGPGCCRRLAEAAAAQQRRPTPRRSCSWCARATRRASRTGTTWSSPASQVITPNPKTSGGARWNYLAAWGYALKQARRRRARRKEFVGELYKNVPVLDTGARGSTDDLRRARHRRRAARLGERGVPGAAASSARTSSRSSRRRCQHPGRAAGRGRRQGRRQEGHARGRRGLPGVPVHRGRPGDRREATSTGRAIRRSRRSTRSRSPRSSLFTIDDVFGGWTKAQKDHFADGGIFDQIYKN